MALVLVLDTVFGCRRRSCKSSILCDGLLKPYVPAYWDVCFLQRCSIYCVCGSNLDAFFLYVCPHVDSRRLEGVVCLWMCIRDYRVGRGFEPQC